MIALGRHYGTLYSISRVKNFVLILLWFCLCGRIASKNTGKTVGFSVCKMELSVYQKAEAC